MSTLDQSNLFHHGIVVDDLEAAIAVAAREFGLTFSAPWPTDQRIRTAQGEQTVPMNMSYSCEEGVRVELIQAVPGTLWQVVEGPATIHHLGYWTDDLAADGDRLAAAGLELAFENVPDEGQDPTFRYYRSDLGYYIELVHTSLRPILEQLWQHTLAQAGVAATADAAVEGLT